MEHLAIAFVALTLGIAGFNALFYVSLGVTKRDMVYMAVGLVLAVISLVMLYFLYILI